MKPLPKLKKDLDKVFNDIELTPEELKAAILEGKKRKYFRLKHAGHWKDLKETKTENYYDGSRSENTHPEKSRRNQVNC